MPIYNFKCPKCDRVSEVKLSLKEHSEQKNSIYCTTCNVKVVQCVESIGFNLTGGGWYKDGYSPSFGSKAELDKELKIYDQHRDNAANNKHDRRIEED